MSPQARPLSEACLSPLVFTFTLHLFILCAHMGAGGRHTPLSVCTHGGGLQAHATISVHTWGRVASTSHCQCAHVEVGCRHTPQSMCMHMWGQVTGTRHCQCAHVEVRTQLLGDDSLLSPNGSQRLNSGNLVWVVSTFNL